MPPYASGTDVPVDRSKAELDKLLQKHGASRFLSGWDERQIVIGFEMHGRGVKIQIPAPSKNDREIRETPSGRYRRTDAAIMEAWQAALRQRWRALVLVVKAKLEAVDAGVATFETEFLGHLVLPGGATVGELVIPRLDDLPRQLTAGEGG
jgi:hypothetical protein